MQLAVIELVFCPPYSAGERSDPGSYVYRIYHDDGRKRIGGTIHTLHEVIAKQRAVRRSADVGFTHYRMQGSAEVFEIQLESIMSGLTERLNQSALNLDSIDSIESTLTNCVRIAAERFEQHEKDLREGTNGMETLDSETRARLAQQFKSQHKEARELVEAIDKHGLVGLITIAEVAGSKKS